MTAEVLNMGKKLYEGKTKEVYELLDNPSRVLLQSKDQITAGNAARKNHPEGKAAVANKITRGIFQLLQEAGIKTAFTKKCGETAAFIAPQCEMIPIEWVCRRKQLDLSSKGTLVYRRGTSSIHPKWRCSSRMMPIMIHSVLRSNSLLQKFVLLALL